jgi:TonB family protein
MVTMTIYTATKTYATHVPLAVALPAHDATFRSVPFAIENPASEPFEATEIDFEGTHVIGGCVVRFRLADRTPSDVDLREAYAGLDPSRPPTQLLRVIVEGNTLTCKNPYASARFDGLEGGRLDYPAMARIMGQTGTVLVKVSLTETGAVDGVAVYHSSRSSYLDQAALNAAQHAHYRPELFRCVPVPGAYLFRADFGAR